MNGSRAKKVIRVSARPVSLHGGTFLDKTIKNTGQLFSGTIQKG